MGKIRALPEFQAWLEQRSAGYPAAVPKPTFNAFLRTRDSEHACWVVEDLDRHGVEVTAWSEMADFMSTYPEYFRKATPEEMAAGLESVQSLYRDFEEQRRRDYWEQRRITPAIPLRRMGTARALRSW